MNDRESKEIEIPDSARIRLISKKLVASIANEQPGVSPAEMQWLENGRDSFNLISEINQEGRTPTEAEIDKLKKAGLFPDRTDARDAYIASELLDALHSTFQLIDRTDAKKSAENQYQGHEHVAKAAEANIEFLDFFIKIHQKFDISRREISRLMNLLFEEQYLDEELEMKGIGSFPRGVIASVNAYLELAEEYPEWDFSAPSVEMDLNHSVDLIAISPKRTINKYYEIKGNSKQQDVQVKRITTQRQLDRFIDDYLPSTGLSDEVQGRWRVSAERLHDFVRDQNSVPGNKTKHRAYFVPSPSNIPATI